MMSSTGIQTLDRLLGGGIPCGKCVLFVSEPVVDSCVFGMHLLSRHPSPKKFVVLVRMSERAFRETMSEYGLNVPDFEVVDCYSAIANEEGRSMHVVENPRDISEVNNAVLAAVGSNKECMVFVDDVNAFGEYLGGDNAAGMISGWARRIRELGGVGAFVYTRWQADSPLLKQLEDAVDCTVSLKALEKKVIFGQCFSVDKAGWAGVEPVFVPFKVIKPGGVRVFIPKVLVTGPYNAGKSSFIHSASTRAVSVDRIGTTVALDHGHVDFSGCLVDLFGTPGQARFDSLLEMLGGEALGVVLVVDSTDPESFPRAMEMLSKASRISLPCIVAANKADLPGALPVGEIRRILQADDSLPILSVHADNCEDAKNIAGKVQCQLKKEDVDAVLKGLFELIFLGDTNIY